MTGVNDLYSQDSHQLFLAHLYTYMVENNLRGSAMQLFNESPVPRDPEFHEFTSNLPPSHTSENWLWDWWLLLWTLMPQSAPTHPVYDHGEYKSITGPSGSRKCTERTEKATPIPTSSPDSAASACQSLSAIWNRSFKIYSRTWSCTTTNFKESTTTTPVWTPVGFHGRLAT